MTPNDLRAWQAAMGYTQDKAAHALGMSASGYKDLVAGVRRTTVMSTLEAALMDVGIEPVYAFSVRESVDQRQPDGSVRKVAVFRHVGFVPSR